MSNVPHQESLLHVPLVRTMLEDTRVSLVRRPVDRTWTYTGVVPVSVAGFNPYRGEVYVAERSALASWLDAPFGSARDLNTDDRLVRELLFAVHDYLHVWSVQAIRALRPELDFGSGRIDAQSMEDYAFCHILTETAATVGLDYWYLVGVDLNAIAPIGTAVRGLTVAYDERNACEFRRFRPSLCVQSPSFFGDVARFYCSGKFGGFGKSDIARSPLLLQWMRHELQYGQSQRKYIRQWLGFLSEGEVPRDDARLAAPIAIDAPWKAKLIDDLGALLWSKVKENASDSFAPLDPAAAWASPRGRAPDFRFVNAHAGFMGDRAAAREALMAAPPGARAWLTYQWLCAHRFDDVDPQAREATARLLSLGEHAAVLALPLGRRVDVTCVQARDVFLPN